MSSQARLTVVGMCPNSPVPVDRPELTLAGSSGARLAKLLGWEFDDYLARTVRVNLVSSRPEWGWPRERAEEVARALGCVLEGRVLLLGRCVAEALMVSWELDTLPVYRLPAGRMIRTGKGLAIPHPSGLCRWYNSTKNRDRVTMALRRLLR